MLETIILLIIILSLLVFHVSVRYSRSGKLMNKIPGPTPFPIMGNLLMFNVSGDKMWDVILQLLDDYYPIVRLWSVKLYGLFIRHPDDMRILLSCKKNMTKCQTVYGTLRADNDGLIISGGEKWRERRKFLNPAFNPSLLRVYTEIVNEHTVQLITNMKQENLVIVPDIVTVFLKLAMGVICESAKGVNPKRFGVKEEEKFRHSYDDLCEIAFYRTSRPYIKDWMMKFLPVGRIQDRAVKFIENYIDTIIRERREYNEKVGYRKFQNMVDDVEDETFSDQRKRLALLDLLLAAEKENLIDASGIKEEVKTFIVAAYETTGIAMAFTLMLLAENKEWQDLCREEITEVLSQSDGVLTMSDINKLECLDRCIKETLRMYPSAPIFGRCITDELELSHYKIPVGCDVAIQLFALHRDPNFWPNPEKYDPDRFLPENTLERHPFAFLPFSAGPRTCIGFKFAMLEVKAVVARFLHNFYIEPVDSPADLSFKVHITLKPTSACRIKLIKIDRK